ncbi:MAG: hypothetical protein QOJ52_2705, partial [Acidimicrobiaceae bacterium]|nr:hypothetical protein [Acidimicrobiaceae bacterium]
MLPTRWSWRLDTPAAGMPFEEARTRMWMGQVLRRAGHRNEAQRALEAAASLFAELGTPLYADRARAELGRLGGRVAGPFTLTVTEKRVADLVGAGRTNQEVAETLFVSVRTVESHLGRTYRKLGLRSRTELARCMTACLADIADWVSSLIGVRLPARGAEEWLVLHGQGWNPATGIWARRGDETGDLARRGLPAADALGPDRVIGGGARCRPKPGGRIRCSVAARALPTRSGRDPFRHGALPGVRYPKIVNARVRAKLRTSTDATSEEYRHRHCCDSRTARNEHLMVNRRLPTQSSTTASWKARHARGSGERKLSRRRSPAWQSVLTVSLVVLLAEGLATPKGVAAPSHSDRRTGWSIQAMPTPATTLNGHLDAVSCSTSDSCVAVGYSHDNVGVDVTLAEYWDGVRWSIQRTPNPEGANNSFLTGVACASATECLAVGDFIDASGQQLALAEHWDGKRWESQPMPSPAGQAETFLTALSCFSPSACTAVGYSRELHPAEVVNHQSPMATVAERWDGSRWQVQPTPNVAGDPTGSQLSSVSCGSAFACTAVGYSGELYANSQSLAESWNGTTWTRQEPPGEPGSTNNVMSSVSCAGAGDCLAVGRWFGDRGKTGGALAERWNGTAWVVLSTPSRHLDVYDAVSCAAANACVLLGRGFNDVVAARWDGTSWVTIPAPSTGGSSLSCSAINACTVVRSGGGTDGATSASRWNGSSWTTQSTVDVTGAAGSFLWDVSCPTDHMCVAVGHYANSANAVLPLIERWNGNSWKIEPAPTLADSFLTGVSCAGPDDCVAVGGYRDGGGDSVSLAEHWDGAHWSVQPTPNPAGAIASNLYAVSCAGNDKHQQANGEHRQTICIAVGAYGDAHHGGSATILAERWQDGVWAIESVPVPTGATYSQLGSVSCPTTTACTLIGSYRTGCSACVGDPAQAPPPQPCDNGCMLVEHWDGTRWEFQHP